MVLIREMSPEHRKRDNYVDADALHAHGAHALLLRLSSCAGVVPLRARRAHPGWRLTVSPSLVRLQRLFIALLNILILTGLILDFYQEPKKRVRVGETFLMASIWITDQVLVMLIASIAVCAAPAQMKSLRKVLTQLQQITKDLNMAEPPAKTEKIKSFALIIFLIWTILILAMDFALYFRYSIQEDNMRTVMCLYGAYYVGNLQGVLVVLQWSLAAAAVHATAASLNQHLERLRYANLLPEPSAKLEDFLGTPVSSLVDCITGQAKAPVKLASMDSEFSMYSSQAQATIRRLALSYDRISSIMRQMNEANGVILMTILTSTFLRLVVTPYYMLIELSNPDKNWLFGIFLPLNWCVAHMTTLILTIEPCHWTQAQRERTEALLSQLIVHVAPQCERLSREVDQFAKQILLSDARFMPLGVYTLARPLMATILGGVTTYLVIIIQFQAISNQL